MFKGIEIISSTSDWVTVLFMIVLILIAILQFNYTERFSKLFSLVYSEKYYTDYIKTRPLIFNSFHTIFFFVIIFNISLFLYFSYNTFYSASYQGQFYFFLQILLCTFGYFIVRNIIGIFLGNIFEVEEGQKYFTF